jgi:hypothetical protein
MNRYAKLATKAARCRDVDLLTAEFDRQVREADARGVKQDLLDYLDYKEPYDGINFRRQYGLINGRLFITSADMCAFHEAAVKERAKQKISELEHLPGFDAWFAAWVTPQKQNAHGRAQVDGVAEEVLERREPAGMQHSTPQAAAPSPILAGAAQGGQRGRRPSKATLAVYQFCHELYVNSTAKLVVIREKARLKFGPKAPKTDSNVVEYARRYAKRNHLPFTPRTSHETP